MTSKWARGTGGPAGDECQNLVPKAAGYATQQDAENGALITTYQNTGTVVEHPVDEVAPTLTGGTDTPENHGKRSGSDRDPLVLSFKPSHYTRGKDGAPSEINLPLSADADKRDQDAVVLTDNEPIAFNMRGREEGNVPEVDPDNLANIRAASGGSTRTLVATPDRPEDFFANPRQLRNSESSNQVGLKFDGKSDALCSDGPGAVVHPGEPIAFDTTQITHRENRSRPEPGDPSRSLAKSAHPLAIATSMRVRRLMPVECERLQGFSDHYTLIEWKGKPAAECPDGPRYMALGNSMAVPVMRWIGERIDRELGEEEP